MFDITKPHCFNADCCITFKVEDNDDYHIIVTNILKRYKRYLKNEIKTLKHILILEAPVDLKNRDEFGITFSMTALVDELLNKHRLELIGEQIAYILESMTMELNAQWIRPIRSRKGHFRKK